MLFEILSTIALNKIGVEIAVLQIQDNICIKMLQILII